MVNYAAATILEFVRSRPARALTVLIDGPSGSGKTQLTSTVLAEWPHEEPPQLLRVDTVCPGWEGLSLGSELIVTDLLRPRAAGLTTRILTYNWVLGVAGPYRVFQPDRPLIIEGCGALTRDSRLFADYAVWLEAPLAQRKERAIQRDGEIFAEHWDSWAEQERQLYFRENSRALADEIFDTGK
ncbi:ATP-binding protein [Lysinibacter sp. HNR]|uniref:ATP-binding protein n=1 Tax=Lysinibacter sp. HNR TaxID=3031408 RepID=UPI0024347DC2|nr:ATP-binding protein [Lysinibacter sp. HNR]WGD38446.1 ATP-binding protein [Lysinibacter sp. HNR]